GRAQRGSDAALRGEPHQQQGIDAARPEQGVERGLMKGAEPGFVNDGFLRGRAHRGNDLGACFAFHEEATKRSGCADRLVVFPAERVEVREIRGIALARVENEDARDARAAAGKAASRPSMGRPCMPARPSGSTKSAWKSMQASAVRAGSSLIERPCSHERRMDCTVCLGVQGWGQLCLPATASRRNRTFAHSRIASKQQKLGQVHLIHVNNSVTRGLRLAECWARRTWFGGLLTNGGFWLTETFAHLEVALKAEALTIGSFATAQRWRTECAPGWRAALPGAPVRR